LRDRRKQIAGSMSGGEQQMLAIGRALMAEPKLLLIDELSLGLMPKMVDLCFEALAQLRRGGLTVVLVEQNTTRALDIADTVCILASGAAVFSGPAAAVRNDASLFETFLGVAMT
jgi:branched-chain amino acid transport system ATP-binding protein